MELVILGLVILFLYVLIRSLSTFSAWLGGQRYRAYRNLAVLHRGRYESRGLSDPPTVSFIHNGSTVRVGLAPTIAGQPEQIPRTRVVARFGKGIPFRLELAPVTRPAPPQPPRGTRPVRVNDPQFDRAYVVQANDHEMARDFLSKTVRASVENLQRMVHPGGMLVSINPERMLVQVDRNLGQSNETLAQAVREALVIHEGLLDGVARRMGQGIAIVEHADAWEEDVGPPICKVCLEPITEGAVILCAACNTPHHRDCWEYVGACSIYGCNGKVGVTE
jgi:Prokaryotic RING finger family 1